MKKGLLALLSVCVLLGAPSCGKKDKKDKAPKKEHVKKDKKDHMKKGKDKAKKGMDKAAKPMGY